MSNAAVLRVLNGPQKAQQLSFDDDREYVVGRKRDCDLPITDGYMSRQHFRIFAEANAFVIEDAGSSHGTMLNGHKLAARAVLQDGDLIKAGQTDFVFQAGTEIRASKASRKTIHGSPKTVLASALGTQSAASAASNSKGMANEPSRNVPTEINEVPESLAELFSGPGAPPGERPPPLAAGAGPATIESPQRPAEPIPAGEKSEWDLYWDDVAPGATQSAAESPPFVDPRTLPRSLTDDGSSPLPSTPPSTPADPSTTDDPPPAGNKEGDDLDWWTA